MVIGDTINAIIINVTPYTMFLSNGTIQKYDTISSLDVWGYWDVFGVFKKQISRFIQNKLWNIK